MKVVQLAPLAHPQQRHPDGHFIPEGKWIPTAFERQLVTSTHPFLQQLLDEELPIHSCLGELVLFIAESMFWIKAFEDHIRIEYMATHAEKRQRGSAKRSMKIICRIADATGTTLKLTTDVVKKLERKRQSPTHPVVVRGIEGKARIPASKLVNWFQTFGFIKGQRSATENVDYRGYHMERTPKSKKE